MAAEGNTLLVRRYRDDDHDAVWALHNLALDSVGAHGANGPWDDDLHSIPSVYIDARGEFLVGRVDGDIVAIGALRQSGPGQGEIKRMRVHPRFQRWGFGREILFRLENRARELGYETLYLDTTVGQTAAQALYRCHGYMETRRTQLGPFEAIRSRSPFARDPVDTPPQRSVPCRDALPLRRDARAEPEIRRSRFRSTRSRPPGYPPRSAYPTRSSTSTGRDWRPPRCSHSATRAAARSPSSSQTRPSNS